jgi:hypothetical protein
MADDATTSKLQVLFAGAGARLRVVARKERASY